LLSIDFFAWLFTIPVHTHYLLDSCDSSTVYSYNPEKHHEVFSSRYCRLCRRPGFAHTSVCPLLVASIVIASSIEERFCSTSLSAVGALVKKAKEASLRQYIADGIEDSGMEQYNKIKSALEGDDTIIDLTNQLVGPLQETLTKRKGDHYRHCQITEVSWQIRAISTKPFNPKFCLAIFENSGPMALPSWPTNTWADVLMRVCKPLWKINVVPAPVAVINNDLIIDELQIARTAAYDGVSSVVLSLDLLGADAI
jgi:hypothetical protein